MYPRSISPPPPGKQPSALNRGGNVTELAVSPAAPSPQPGAPSSDSASSYFTANSIKSRDSFGTEGSYKTATGEPAEFYARSTSPSIPVNEEFGRAPSIRRVQEGRIATSRTTVSPNDSFHVTAENVRTTSSRHASEFLRDSIHAERTPSELSFRDSGSRSSIGSLDSGDSDRAISHLSRDSRDFPRGDLHDSIDIDRAPSTSDIDRIGAIRSSIRPDRPTLLARALLATTQLFVGGPGYRHRGLGKKAAALGERENLGQLNDSPQARFNTRGGGKLVGQAFRAGGLAGGLNELYRQAKIRWAKSGPYGDFASHGYAEIDRGASNTPNSQPSRISEAHSIQPDDGVPPRASTVTSQIRGNQNASVSRDIDAPRHSNGLEAPTERTEHNQTASALDAETIAFGDLSLKMLDLLEHQAGNKDSEQRGPSTAPPLPQPRRVPPRAVSPAKQIDDTIRANLTSQYLQQHGIETESDLKSHIQDMQMLEETIAQSSLLKSTYASPTTPIRPDRS